MEGQLDEAAPAHRAMMSRRLRIEMRRFLLCVAALAVSGWVFLPGSEDLARDDETHLRNVRQLTFGGENAEAYFSSAEDQLIFQSTRPPYACDQIFTMKLDGSDLELVSTGKGRTTCGYFLPEGKILYASTHLAGEACPPRPSFSRGYVWPVYKSYDIFLAGSDGAHLERVTDTPGYDAEATVSPDGRRTVHRSSTAPIIRKIPPSCHATRSFSRTG
jgi:Tol biopolymer transport system component